MTSKEGMAAQVILVLNEEEVRLLRTLLNSDRLGGSGGISVSEVVEALVDSACDGVRRPGSWERQWLTQAFGSFDDDGDDDAG